MLRQHKLQLLFSQAVIVVAMASDSSGSEEYIDDPDSEIWFET